MGGSALIAGGGIGGLAAALALDRTGWRVKVLEQAPAFDEIGAGLQISPNGVKILQALGVMERIEPLLFEPEAVEIRHGPTGASLMRIPMKGVAERRWGARYIHIHRADLHAALAAALGERQPDAIRTGARVERAETEGEAARVRLADGSSLAADLVVAADGIHSRLRSQMHGADRPRFTGNVAWRAVVPADALGPLAPPPSACVWTGPGRHAVTTRLRAGALVNFVGLVEEDGWHEEGWKIEGRREDALAAFGGWNPTLRHIIEKADRLWRWALFARPPLPSWSAGRVALLGDAAHPMLPSMAQGAVQALEDAVVLAFELDRRRNVPSALRAYSRERIGRASRVQRLSEANARLFHRRSLPAQALSYGPMWLAGRLAPGLANARFDWIYRWEPPALPARAS